MASYRSIYTGTQIDEFLTKAKELEEDILTKTPYIGENDNWFVWDNDNQIFVDTGITAKGYSGMYYGNEEPEPYKDGSYPVWILDENDETTEDFATVDQINTLTTEIENLKATIQTLEIEIEALKNPVVEEGVNDK